MAINGAHAEMIQTHKEKIENLEHTVDDLKKTIEDLLKNQDARCQQFEGRFQQLEDRLSDRPSPKAKSKDVQDNKVVTAEVEPRMSHVEPMMSDVLHPGPTDESILTLQHDHRSTAVWRGEDFEPLTCRRCDGAFWRLGALDSRVQRFMLQAGFYGVYKAGHVQLDHALITALIERWRQETHTFHLPVGEATVTLQDVAILWGLPIDGEPVTGVDITRSTEEWQAMCEELLGFRPPASAFDSGRLKMKCIEEHFEANPLLADAPDHLVQCYARAHILQLLGGLLLPDSSNNKAKLMYLPLLRDFEAAGKLSWGSAVLASLYRALCRATKSTVDGVSGPLVLLQIWAWERIPLIRPERLAPQQQPSTSVADGVQPLPPAPYGSRWDVGFKLEKVGMHVLVVYRDMLDYMKDDQFVWQPYTDDFIASLPDYCLSGQDIWQTVSPLICFDVVELHHPDRVLRQFGQRQTIPAHCDTVRDLHLIDRRGRQNCDWAQHHRQYIDMWADRCTRVVSAPPADGPMDYSDPYLIWYRRITRRLIGNPANRRETGYPGLVGTIELMAQSLQQIYYICSDAIENDEVSKSNALREIQDICSSTLKAAREDRRLTVRPEITPPPPVSISSAQPQIRRRRPRRGGGTSGGSVGERRWISSNNSLVSTPLTLEPSSFTSPSCSPQLKDTLVPDAVPESVTLAIENEEQEATFASPDLPASPNPDITPMDELVIDISSSPVNPSASEPPSAEVHDETPSTLQDELHQKPKKRKERDDE